MCETGLGLGYNSEDLGSNLKQQFVTWVTAKITVIDPMFCLCVFALLSCQIWKFLLERKISDSFKIQANLRYQTIFSLFFSKVTHLHTILQVLVRWVFIVSLICHNYICFVSFQEMYKFLSYFLCWMYCNADFMSFLMVFQFLVHFLSRYCWFWRTARGTLKWSRSNFFI